MLEVIGFVFIAVIAAMYTVLTVVVALVNLPKENPIGGEDNPLLEKLVSIGMLSSLYYIWMFIWDLAPFTVALK